MTTFAFEGSRPTVLLRPGDSIQAAIDGAAPGATVQLAEGRFTEQLHIDRSDIVVAGAGAGRTVLVPPPMPRMLEVPALHEGGPHTASGITVHECGDGVQDVAITGLTVRGFAGAGVYVHSAAGVTVSDVEVVDNEVWGVYVHSTVGITLARITASGSRYAGLGISFSPAAGALVTDNVCTGNAYGIFIDNSSTGVVRRNVTTGNCSGILMLNQVYPGEPPGGVEDWLVSDNSVSDNGRTCGVDRDGLGANGAPISGNGIALVGTRNVVVVGNRIFANVASGHSVVPAGLAVTSSAEFGGADPDGNQLLWNDLSGNEPRDVLVDGDVGRQVVAHNRGATTHPVDLAGVDGTTPGVRS